MDQAIAVLVGLTDQSLNAWRAVTLDEALADRLRDRVDALGEEGVACVGLVGGGEEVLMVVPPWRVGGDVVVAGWDGDLEAGVGG